MYSIKGNQLGWIVAAGLGGILIGGGFEPAGPKYGVVDVNQVMGKSAMGTAFSKALEGMKSSRQGLLQFIGQHLVMTPGQANDLKELYLKPTPTADDKAKIESIQKDVLDSEKKYQDVQQKQNPTDDDRKLLAFDNNEVRGMEETVQLWARQLSQEVQDFVDKQNRDLEQAARAAIQEVGKAQGYTVLYDTHFTPYGANDVTDAAIKAMDAAKK
jgi:Skp family chaperone for outer membrane proteins